MVSVLYCAHLWAKGPLIFPVFLKRSLACPLLLFSSSVMYCSLKKGFMSLLFFGTLNLVGCAFPFLPCFSLLFFFQLFVKPPQVTTLPSCFSFSLDASSLLNINFFTCKWSKMTSSHFIHRWYFFLFYYYFFMFFAIFSIGWLSLLY